MTIAAHRISRVDADASHATFDFPDVSAHDLPVPMGAPCGAGDDEEIGRWLVPEIAWLRAALVGAYLQRVVGPLPKPAGG